MPKKTLIITAIIVVIIAIGATATYMILRQGGEEVERQEEVATTTEAPPVTQPGIEEPVVQPKEPTTTQPEEPKQPTTTEPIDTSNWKTYRNEEFGFEVKYPSKWEIASERKEVGNSLFAVYFRNPSWIAYEGAPPMTIQVFSKAVLKGKNLKEWLEDRDVEFPYEFLENDTLFNKSTLITRTYDIYGSSFYQAWIYSDDYLYVIGVGGDQNIETLKKVISGFNFLNQESEERKEG